MIVVDFFHWPHQGDWRFDPRITGPIPRRWSEELKEMGIELMVSIWPHGGPASSENFKEMREEGYLIAHCERGIASP